MRSCCAAYTALVSRHTLSEPHIAIQQHNDDDEEEEKA